jgi:hypothetical protein
MTRELIDATTFKLAEETQWIIFGILAIAWILLWRWKWVAWTALWFVVALIVRRFSDVPPDYDPMLLPAEHGIPTGWVINIVLYLDLGFIGLLVFKTGGSELSPFTPLYFVLPTFALLILGETWEVYYFAFAAILVFGLSLFFASEKLHHLWVPGEVANPDFVRSMRRASVWVSAACLFWVMLIDIRRPTIQAEMNRRRSAIPHAAKTEASPSVPPQTRSETPQPRTTANPTPTAAPLTEERHSQPPDGPSPAVTGSPIPTPPADRSARPSSLKDRTPENFRQSGSTYSSFLDEFRNPDPKTARDRHRLLKRHVQNHISWKVRFRDFRRLRNEFKVSFAEVDTQDPPRAPPVKFAKVPKRFAHVLGNLPTGAIIVIEGRLDWHSKTELFVVASSIRVVQ